MMKVVFLGTGSAVPTPHRNLSSTAVEHDGRVFLFDCGEGTQIQYRRAGLRPGKLEAIFISHFHGDHLYGLPGFLASLQMAERSAPLRLFGPRGLARYIAFHQKITGFTPGFPVHIAEMPGRADYSSWEIEGFDVECRPLAHRMRCLGWALRQAPRPGKFDAAKADALGIPPGPERAALLAGRSIVLADGTVIEPKEIVGPPRPGLHLAYCVDTRPTASIIALAREADILIHDATFSAEEAEKAHETGHSTTRDAAEMARQAHVRCLALTHLSGRFTPQDEPALLEQARTIFPRTIIARDLLCHEVSYREP